MKVGVSAMYPNGPLSPERRSYDPRDMCYRCGSSRCLGCPSPEFLAEKERQARVREADERHQESVKRQKWKLKRLPPRK